MCKNKKQTAKIQHKTNNCLSGVCFLFSTLLLLDRVAVKYVFCVYSQWCDHNIFQYFEFTRTHKFHVQFSFSVNGHHRRTHQPVRSAVCTHEWLEREASGVKVCERYAGMFDSLWIPFFAFQF